MVFRYVPAIWLLAILLTWLLRMNMQHVDTLCRTNPKNDWQQTCKPGCGERTQSLSPLGSRLSLAPVIPAFWKAKLLRTTRIHWLLGPAYDPPNFESNIISKCFASSIPNDLRRGLNMLQNLLRRAEPFESRGMNWNSIRMYLYVASCIRTEQQQAKMDVA